MIETFYLAPWLGALGAAIVARPFAERTFDFRIVEMHVAFDDDLRVRRNRQPGILAFDHLKRLPAHTADEFILRHAVGHLDAAGQKSQRVVAEGHGDLEWLSAGGVFFALDAAVFAR